MKKEKTPEQLQAALTRAVPPRDLEAEAAVIGNLLTGNTPIIHEVMGLLAPDDFHSPAHRSVYEAMVRLYSGRRPIDIITVKDELGDAEVARVGGPVYLAELADSVVSPQNAAHHARVVKGKATLRKVMHRGLAMACDALEPCADPDTVLQAAESSIFDVAQAMDGPTVVTMNAAVGEVFDNLDRIRTEGVGATGVPTGLADLDHKLVGGLQNSDLIIVAARPSMGKTALALNLAYRASIMTMKPVTTAVFSLEMSRAQLTTRMLSTASRIDLTKIREARLTDADWVALNQAGDDLARSPLLIDDTPALSLLQLSSRCRKIAAESKTSDTVPPLGLVVVDYLQLMQAGFRSDSRELEIAAISRGLKALAKELDVPVIALSQLNRKVEERTDRRPIMSDLRESGAIEQDSDVIIFLYRDYQYNKSPDNPLKNHAEVIVSKQRNGPTGTVELFFDPACTRFDNLVQDPPAHLS